MSATDYLLLKQKLQHENVLKRHKGLDDRAKQIKQHKLASHRNFLENEKRTLNLELNKMAPSVRAHYLDRIEELSRQITASKENTRFSGDSMTERLP